MLVYQRVYHGSFWLSQKWQNIMLRRAPHFKIPRASPTDEKTTVLDPCKSKKIAMAMATSISGWWF